MGMLKARAFRARTCAVIVGTVALWLIGATYYGNRSAASVSAERQCPLSGTQVQPTVQGASPAHFTRSSKTTRHFEYVVTTAALHVYDIDRGNRLIQQIGLPQLASVHGVVASPTTGMLYIACGGQGGIRGPGGLIAYDLRTDRVVWQRDYDTGIDSMAITPNGRTIYMPSGEYSGSDLWNIIDARTGAVTGSIKGGIEPHNTIMGLDGKRVYLGGIGQRYLYVASTATNTILRKIGPLLYAAGRPYTINGAQTLAFTTSDQFLGFQVSSISTGKVLYTVGIPGFPYNPATFTRSPCHGISLSPDERRLFVIDTPNGYVHVFDVSHASSSRPKRLADIKLDHPPPYDGWLQHSRDGRYVYVGRAGDVIDTKTLRIVHFLPPLQETADSLEIDWRAGRPAGTTSRYGLGYVVPR